MAEIQRKCAEKQLKNTYRKLVPARADDRAVAFGAAAVTFASSFWNTGSETGSQTAG